MQNFRMQKKSGIAMVTLVLAILLTLGSSCSLKKPYVGMQVNTDEWTKFRSGEKLVLNTNAAQFVVTITEKGSNGEYYLEGYLDGQNGSLKSIDYLVVEECSFSFLLAKDGVIVDNVSFFPIGTDHTHKLPFKKNFTTVPFDSIAITYQISVSG